MKQAQRTERQLPPADALPRRLWRRMGDIFRRLRDQLTSRNARMPGESACRLCGVCHHLCGMIAAPRREIGSPEE